jgi:very-short-patch-repair endonuclease
MRRAPTEAEKAMWLMLRDRRLVGFKFRRQVPVDRFIADFLCYEARLIIELDGHQHVASEHDSQRDAYLRAQRFGILRFWNNDVLARPELVLEAIWLALHPSSGAARHLLPQGEKGDDCEFLVPASLQALERPAPSPSPLAGEGARRADEGAGSGPATPTTIHNNKDF